MERPELPVASPAFAELNARPIFLEVDDRFSRDPQSLRFCDETVLQGPCHATSSAKEFFSMLLDRDPDDPNN